VAESAKRIGGVVKGIQTGKVQQYMLIALVLMFSVLIYFVFYMLP
jgi:hypothetical protein